MQLTGRIHRESADSTCIEVRVESLGGCQHCGAAPSCTFPDSGGQTGTDRIVRIPVRTVTMEPVDSGRSELTLRARSPLGDAALVFLVPVVGMFLAVASVEILLPGRSLSLSAVAGLAGFCTGVVPGYLWRRLPEIEDVRSACLPEDAET